MRSRFVLVFTAVAVVLAVVPVSADVHTVFVNEYYTQCDDGSTAIQYIEMKPIAPLNFFRQCASIEVKRTVGGANLFFAKPVFQGHADDESFPTNKTFLIATPAFQSKTGIVPDLILPNNTMDKAGGVIRFAADSGCPEVNWGTIHEVRYGDQGTDPAPGPNQAANYSGGFTLGSPSPTNFAGSTATSWTCVVVPVDPSTWSRIKATFALEE